MLWFRTHVADSIPNGDKKVFFINLVIMYWTLNSIYMQFEYQYSKSSNVFVEHVQLLREMLDSSNRGRRLDPSQLGGCIV